MKYAHIIIMLTLKRFKSGLGTCVAIVVQHKEGEYNDYMFPPQEH